MFVSKPETNNPQQILLTGATGYVGGRLLPLLTADGHNVRCLLRRESSVENFASDSVETVIGDVLDEDSLDAALIGVHTAYYLIHSCLLYTSPSPRDRG